MKIIAWLAGVGTLLAAGIYMIVSLNRWEWNRTLFFGLIVVIAEIGLATGLILRRLARIEHRTEVDPEIAEIFRTTRSSFVREELGKAQEGNLDLAIPARDTMMPGRSPRDAADGGHDVDSNRSTPQLKDPVRHDQILWTDTE